MEVVSVVHAARAAGLGVAAFTLVLLGLVVPEGLDHPVTAAQRQPTLLPHGDRIAVQIATVMAQERAALSALKADRLRELGGVETTPMPAGVEKNSPVAANVAALNRADTEATRLATVAQDRPAPPSTGEEMVTLNARDLDRLPAKRGDRQWRCLAEALYHEARGEKISGQIAVAEVILNRVESRRFPNSVCGVINQGTGRRNACQFSYTCDGRSDRISEHKAFQRVGKIAQLMLDGQPRLLTDGATFYHASRVRPKWSRVFTRTARIGSHVFYKHSS